MDPNDFEDSLTPEEAERLRFLVAEGLQLLEKFRLIRDPEKRRQVLELVASLADTEPPPMDEFRIPHFDG